MLTFRPFCIGLFAYTMLLISTAVDASRISDHPESFYGQAPTYTITRNGKKIGRHKIAFNRLGDQLKVAIETNITVSFLKIPVYRFQYSSTEIWEKSQLRAVNSTIVENRETRVIESNQFDRLRANHTDGVRFATNHWNPDILTESVVFNTITGNSNTVTVKAVGTETIAINDREVFATQYRYSGDLQVDTWYDEAGRWIKLRFSGDDGSTIEYISDGFNT